MTPAVRGIFHFVVALTGLVGALAAFAKPAPGLFSANEVSAERDGASIFTAPNVGRFSLRAQSASGARIELVDMIEGPIAASGAAGASDGRIDALLDKGAYKIRVGGAKGATGKVRLAALSFVELNGILPALERRRLQSAELDDLQQRSYGVEVGPEGRLAVEAIGRALADLRLWRESGELVDLPVEKQSVETKPGRAMTRIALEGAIAPGRYVVTAYGGEAAVWPEGAAGRPFHIRRDAALALEAGQFDGVIGPFGVVRLSAPGDYNVFRLELPQPAPARISARRVGSGLQSASIEKNSRDAFVTLFASGDGKSDAAIEISGYEGQAFSVRGVHQDAHFSFEQSGPHLLWVDVAGDGGDEVPATPLLARVERDGTTRVLASDMPRIAGGKPWRGKFNLRGQTTLHFEMVDAGALAIDAKGVKLRAYIEPTFSPAEDRKERSFPARYDLAPGFYTIALEPLDGAVGVVDVTLGPPGVAAPDPARVPSRSVISFGRRELEKDGSYLMLANVAPTLLSGPRVVALPVDLQKGAAPIWQRKGEAVALPVAAAKGGRFVVRDSTGGDVAFTLGPETIDGGYAAQTLTIASAERARPLGLAFVPDPAVAAEKTDGASEAGAQSKRLAAPGHAPLSASAAHPLYFDLSRDQQQEIHVDLPEGGLYRVETLGRLKTALKIGAKIATNLADGADNGPGHNGLATTYLRAGAYRAIVTATDSSGHLGFLAAKAQLLQTPPLEVETSVRATLAPGRGAAIPIHIAQDGVYTIDLLGVRREWWARLEDSEGWPLTKPGKLSRLTRSFEKGVYRLVVSPEDVDARLVARLRANIAPQELSGHGPHALPFEAKQKLQWREPQSASEARAPDIWRFSLVGDADVRLSIGEGMTAEIFRGEKESVGKFAAKRDFKASLSAGNYRIEAHAISRDNRLDYEILLSAKQLQPGAPRYVALPANFDFVLAKPALIDLSTFGDKETLGVLSDADGAVIEQLTGRKDDWNFALSRRLPAGAYRLALHALGKKAPSAQDEEGTEESTGGEEATSGNVAESGEEAQPDPRGRIEVRLSLPVETDEGALEETGVRALTGAGAHELTLPKAGPGRLALVAAQADAEIALSIERRDEAGAWRSVGLRRGLAPVAAWPVTEDDSSLWRAVVWPVGGESAGAIKIVSLSATARERSGENAALEKIDGAPFPLCVGLNRVNRSAIDMKEPSAGLLVGSAPGQLLRDARAGVIMPQSERLWFVGDCGSAIEWKPLDASGNEIVFDLEQGADVFLPALAPAKGKARLWIARSEQGAVWLDAGHGAAVSANETLALASDQPLRVASASGAAEMRVALRAIDVAVAPLAQAGKAYRGVIPAHTALPLKLDIGGAPLALELPEHVAAFSSPAAAPGLALYGGASPLSATYHGAPPSDATLWLINLSDAPAPAFAASASGARETLTAGHLVSGFFPVPGRLVVPVEVAAHAQLFALDGEVRFIAADGRVSRIVGEARSRKAATVPIDGRGVAVFDHSAGLAALWVEEGEKRPWPVARAVALAPPARVPLEGPAAVFSLRPTQPVLLIARMAAPAIVGFEQNGRREVEAHPEGVELWRYVAAGDATLELHGPNGGALSGSLEVFATPIVEAHEGLNDAVTLAPGGTALFAFETKRAGEIGVGLRAKPDRVSMRVLSSAGDVLGEGVAQLHKLAPGRYIVEARAPADAPPSVARLAILGLSPPQATPPDDIVTEILEKAGLKKTAAKGGK